MTCFQDNRRSS